MEIFFVDKSVELKVWDEIKRIFLHAKEFGVKNKKNYKIWRIWCENNMNFTIVG